MSFGARATTRSSNRATRWRSTTAQGRHRYAIDTAADDVAAADRRRHADPAEQPGLEHHNTLTWLKGKHTYTFGGTFRRTTMYQSIGGAPPTTTSASAPAIRRRVCSRRRRSRASARPIDGRARRLRAAHRPHQRLGRHLLPRRGHRSSTDWAGVPPRSAERRRLLRAGSVAHQPAADVQLRPRWDSAARRPTPTACTAARRPRLLGPSTAPFQPGTFNGVAHPQICCGRSLAGRP